MFRIDRRNVKISEAPVSTIIGHKQTEDAAAPLQGEQPCLSAAADTGSDGRSGLTAEQEALIARQLEEIEAARWDVEARVREQEEAALKLREQADKELENAGEKAKQIAEQAREQAKTDAEQIVSAAKTMAENIIAEAREKADAEREKADADALEIRGQAWKSGFAEGREEAEKQAKAEGERLADDLKIFIDGLDRGREDMVARFEKDIIDLSLAIAKKIINVAIKKDDIMFEALIKNALNQMKREGKLSIRLSEEDSSRLFADGSASFVLGGHTVTATVVGDPGLSEGDCVLESDAEIVYAGVDSQIRAVAVAFEKIGDEL